MAGKEKGSTRAPRVLTVGQFYEAPSAEHQNALIIFDNYENKLFFVVIVLNINNMV